MIRLSIAAMFALASPAFVTPAFAETLATGDEITAAVSGNTVQGGMNETGAYTEFYGTDGGIKADGYSGTWTIEGDTMCFDYGEGKTCWNARIDAGMVTWVQDGVDVGTGTVLPGNPNGF